MHILMIGMYKFGSDIRITHPIAKLFICFIDKLIINISKVTAILYFIIKQLEQSIQNIKGNIYSPMTNMSKVIGRNTTYIEQDFSWDKRLKILFFTGHSIGNL